MLDREPPAEAVIRPAGPGRPEVPDHQPAPERPPRGAQPTGAGLHDTGPPAGSECPRHHVPLDGVRLYLAVELDFHARSVVGWAMADRMTQDLVVAALAHGSRATWAGPRRHHPFRPGQPVRLP